MALNPAQMADIAAWMKTFAAAADCGSFSLAAERLGTSQSTVSKHVALLERHLRARLFLRTTRSLTLTDEGAAFYDTACEALAAIDSAEASVGLQGKVRGRMRVTAPLTLAEARVVSMIGEFLLLHDEAAVDLVLSDHAVNLAAEGIDLAIRVGHLGDTRTNARLIGRAERVAVAAPAYLERAGTPQHPAELSGHNCIVYTLLSSGPRWGFSDGSVVQVTGNLRADSPHALRSAALAGQGIVVNARWLFEDALAAGTLVELFPEVPPATMPIHLVLPSGRHIPARIHALASFLKDAFARDDLIRVRGDEADPAGSFDASRQSGR